MEKHSFYPLTTATSRDQHIALRSPEKQSSQFTSMRTQSCAPEGFLRNCVDPAIEKPIIMRVSGAVSVVGEDLANESIVTSIQEILRLNASAVSMSVFVGSKYENKSLTNLAKLVDECEDYGIPVMAVSAVGKELEKREARYLALAARISAEIGARVVKTYYCENFRKVVEGCPVPVVIAGGPKTETQKASFRLRLRRHAGRSYRRQLGTKHLANRAPSCLNQSHPSHNS